MTGERMDYNAPLHQQQQMTFQIQNKDLKESGPIELKTKSEIMNLKQDLAVNNKNANGYLTQNNSISKEMHVPGGVNMQIYRQQTVSNRAYDKSSFLNIYDEVELRKNQN